MIRLDKLFLTVGLIVLTSVVTLIPEIAQAQKLVAVGIAGNDHVYYWSKERDADGNVEFTVHSATTDNRKIYFPRKAFFDSLNELIRDDKLIAAAIAGSNDHVYYWWKGKTLDGKKNVFKVTSGTSQDPTKYTKFPKTFHKFGKKRLLAAAINKNDRVYYWWMDKDGNIYNSVGTSDKATEHIIPRNVEVGFLTRDAYNLVAAGIAKSDDHVYYFWKKKEDGKIYVSSGTSTEPFKYREFYSANLP